MPQHVNVADTMRKVCPYMSQGTKPVYCVGEQCMAWQWVYVKQPEGYVRDGDKGFCSRSDK